MKTIICPYEYEQVSYFILQVLAGYKHHMNKNDCIAAGWIAYLEARKRSPYKLTDSRYWSYIYDNLLSCFENLRHQRNAIYCIESNCSLDKTYGECDEPLQSIIPSHHGDFTKRIALFDFAKRLGYKKDRIVHLLYNGEDKDSILQLLPISGTEYDHIIRELQDDFRYYESL